MTRNSFRPNKHLKNNHGAVTNPKTRSTKNHVNKIVVDEARAAGIEWKEVKALAKNRLRWQLFVNALCSLSV